jgi:hypothetical protein
VEWAWKMDLRVVKDRDRRHHDGHRD